MVGRGHGEAGFAKLGVAILGFAALFFAGSFYTGATFAQYVHTLNISTMLASASGSDDPCEAPGVECKYKRGTSEPASVCLNSQNIDIIAGCNVQRDIAARQVTAGVGREAPDITRIAYSSRECIIETSVGSGPCKRDATRSCPTAIATPERSCFHTNCPGANPCVQNNAAQPSQDTAQEQPTAEEIAEDIQQEQGAQAPGQEGTLEGYDAAFSEDGTTVPIDTRYGTYDVPQSLIDDYRSVYGDDWRAQLEDRLVLGSQVADGSGTIIPDPVGYAQRHIAQYESLSGTNDWSGDQISDGSVTYTPPTQVTPTNPSDGGGTPTPAPATPPPGATPGSVGNPNPATPAPSGGGRTPSVTGGGVYENPGYDFGGSGGGSGFGTDTRNPFGWQEPRYQSLQTPQERALRERMRSHFGGSRELSIVDRFAQLIGADSRPVMRTSPQSIQGGTAPRQIDVVTRTAPPLIIRSTDAHYRSIEQIARDVTRDDIPGDSRVDHFARAVRAVGSPDTQTRATTNEALASLQDLIVEDEAIRAMFVAEQTAEREKNRVFCVDGEESASCQARRTAVAERIERETFVAELQKRELPDNAVQHFLAVYDGWVRPDVPVPASNPLLLADAPASASVTPDAGARATATTTTNEGFVSWAWGGVRNGAERMFEALRQWLTP